MQTPEQLVEKWGQSGLLDGATNKESLAKILEYTSAYFLEYVPKEDEKRLNTSAAIVLPTIRRVLGDRDFTSLHWARQLLETMQVPKFVRETELVKWSEIEGEDAELKICERLEKSFKEKLNKYEELTLYEVATEFLEDGFEVTFRCA